jgi:hypothetical protein
MDRGGRALRRGGCHPDAPRGRREDARQQKESVTTSFDHVSWLRQFDSVRPTFACAIRGSKGFGSRRWPPRWPVRVAGSSAAAYAGFAPPEEGPLRALLLIAALVACEAEEPADTAAGVSSNAGFGSTTTSPTDGELSVGAFGAAFSDAYCAAWASCSTSGEPCPVDPYGTLVFTLPDDCAYDADAAAACVAGPFTCDDTNGAGLEFVQSPEACWLVVTCPGTGSTG